MDRLPTSTGSPPKPSRPEPAARSVRGALAALCLCLCLAAGAAGAAGDLLPADQAFRFSARALDERTLEARFTIADGYYLYRDKLRFAVAPEGPVLGAPVLPAGKIKTDEFFGKVETYRGTLVVKLPLSGALAGQTVLLAADSQGCADVGVCYPPTQQKVNLPLPIAGQPPGALVDATPPRKSWFK
jgi:thiol:disulfide interchange protein DsbD